MLCGIGDSVEKNMGAWVCVMLLILCPSIGCDVWLCLCGGVVSCTVHLGGDNGVGGAGWLLVA